MSGPSVLDPRPGCPELETLAAFAEGRLTQAERPAVIAHLADCDACREVAAETRALWAEAGAADAGEAAAPGEVVPFRRPARRAGRWRPALAAAAVLALGAATVLWLRATPRDAAEVIAELAAEPQTLERLGAAWAEPLWSVTRGDGPLVSDRARAFRLGARSADLELALAAGDRGAARRLAAECAALVGDVPLADPVAHLYRELARRAGEAAEPLPPLAADAATAARLTREAVDPALWELGRWGEAGRLAAAAGAPPGAPALPRDAAVPGDLADLTRHAARPELDATPAQRAAAFAALVARGGDLR